MVFTTFPLPLFSFSTIITPLIQISFSPQPSAAIKIKVGGHDFRYQNTDHSLAKVTPALQATVKLA